MKHFNLFGGKKDRKAKKTLDPNSTRKEISKELKGVSESKFKKKQRERADLERKRKGGRDVGSKNLPDKYKAKGHGKNKKDK